MANQQTITRGLRVALSCMVLAGTAGNAAEVDVLVNSNGAILSETADIVKAGSLSSQDVWSVLVFTGAGTGLDVFGVGSLEVAGNDDPFLAFRYELIPGTTSFIDEGFVLRVSLGIVDTGALVASDAVVQLEVVDRNNDGFTSFQGGADASLLSGTASAPTSQSFLDEGGGSFFPAAGPVTLFDSTGVLLDPSTPAFGTPSDTFNVLEMQVNGSYSKGDSIIVSGYACIADASQACPDRPDLNAFPGAVPLPAAVWLFGSGLVGLLGVASWKGVAASGVRITAQPGT